MSKPKAQICLLSEQPTPNIGPAIDPRLKPDVLVLLVTRQQAERVPHYEAVLRPRGIKVETAQLEDPFSWEETCQVVEQQIARLGSQGVLINATGGTKPMSIGAYMAGFQKSVPVFYVHDDRIEWLSTDGDRHVFPWDVDQLEDRINLKDFLRVHGVQKTGKFDKRILPERKAVAREIIATRGLQRGVRYVNWAGSQCRDKGRLTHDMSIEDQNSEDCQAVLDKFRDAGLIRFKTKNTLEFVDADALRWCTGGWLEDHVAETVQRLGKESDLRIQDSAHGVTVRYFGDRPGSTAGDAEHNEADVVVLANNQLYLIECKTRYMTSAKRVRATEALYKLATLRRELGGSQARAMFVSYFDLSPADKRRASDLGIQLCSWKELEQLEAVLRRWLAPPR